MTSLSDTTYRPDAVFDLRAAGAPEELQRFAGAFQDGLVARDLQDVTATLAIDHGDGSPTPSATVSVRVPAHHRLGDVSGRLTAAFEEASAAATVRVRPGAGWPPRG